MFKAVKDLEAIFRSLLLSHCIMLGGIQASGMKAIQIMIIITAMLRAVDGYLRCGILLCNLLLPLSFPCVQSFGASFLPF